MMNSRGEGDSSGSDDAIHGALKRRDTGLAARALGWHGSARRGGSERRPSAERCLALAHARFAPPGPRCTDCGTLRRVSQPDDSRRQPILSVVFYAGAGGKEPVREWLFGLAYEDREAVGRDIKTAQYGWPLGMPLIRKLDPGLWEVRSSLHQGVGRVLFTIDGQTMVLLHAFVKKSQKTPTADLKTAQQRLADLRKE